MNISGGLSWHSRSAIPHRISRRETTEGKIRFHDWIGDNWAVLFSHPKDFTPVCTTELGYMAKIKPEFDKRGVKIIGLSVDPVDSHAGWANDIKETQGFAPNYPMIGDTDFNVSKLYGMLPAAVSGDPAKRTPADNQTVRNVFVIGPDKKIKLILVYPMTTGRNFDEVLRVIDSLQLTAKHKVATPVNWKHGEDVIIAGSVTDDDAKKQYPQGWKAPKPYIRIVPQPRALTRHTCKLRQRGRGAMSRALCNFVVDERTSASSIVSSRHRGPACRLCCCCTAPAAMRTICCRSARAMPPAPRSLAARQGVGTRHAALLPAAREGRWDIDDLKARTPSWPSSSGAPAKPTASARRSRSAIPTAPTSPRSMMLQRSAGILRCDPDARHATVRSPPAGRSRQPADPDTDRPARRIGPAEAGRSPRRHYSVTAGADATFEMLEAGHGLTEEDLRLAAAWLARHG